MDEVMKDALNKEIKIGEEHSKWWTSGRYEASDMFTGTATKINNKTIQLDDDVNTNHYAKNLLRTKSRQIILRERHLGDTVMFKGGAGTYFGDIYRLYKTVYSVNNIRLPGTDSSAKSNSREVMADECMKVFDGKRTKIKYLKETNNV
jgi:hypothetical protein